jgi:hypothetical protein
MLTLLIKKKVKYVKAVNLLHLFLWKLSKAIIKKMMKFGQLFSKIKKKNLINFLKIHPILLKSPTILTLLIIVIATANSSFPLLNNNQSKKHNNNLSKKNIIL